MVARKSSKRREMKTGKRGHVRRWEGKRRKKNNISRKRKTDSGVRAAMEERRKLVFS